MLEVATLYAAPFAATILADFGAEVIKVEPPAGDPFRGTPMWQIVGRGKRSLAVDLADPADSTAVRELARDYDVVIENLPNRTAASRGLTYDDLAKVNPGLVVVSVTSFGRSGPYNERVGAGTTGEAFGGLTNLTGPGDGAPMLPSVPLGDGVTALTAALGAVTACYHRDARGGQGQSVDVSMYEPILQVLAGGLVTAVEEPGRPHRSGSRLIESPVVRNLYGCADGGWVALVCSTARQRGDLAALVMPDEPTEALGPLELADRIDAATARWAARHSLEEVMDALIEVRIGAAPVNDLDALLRDPHVRDRASVCVVEDADLGPVAVASPAPKLIATPARLRGATAALGEANEELLGRPFAAPAVG